MFITLVYRIYIGMIFQKKALSPVLAFFAGVAWLYGELYWIGLASRLFYPMFHLNGKSTSLHLFLISELSTILIQLVLSLVIAWIVSLIKPKQWLLYSGMAILPTLLMSIITLVRYGLPSSSVYWISYIIGLCTLLVQVPLLLLLLYNLRNSGNYAITIAKRAMSHL